MSSHYRRSGEDLAYGDDHPPPRQRWDKERFDRARHGGSREVDIDFRESDRYNGPRGSGYREVDVDERFTRGGPPRTRYYEDDCRSEFAFRETETAGREMAPYKSNWERDLPPRGYARRQHSPDDYDQRDYHDDERDVNISVHVDNNDRHYAPAPRPPPPRDRYYEEDRYRDRYEDDVRIRAEREREVWRRSGGQWEERDEYHERESERKERRGKTKMPKRLVHKRAIVELGFPFVEEEFFYWVQTPLDQDQIDEVLRISGKFFKEETEFAQKTETKYIEAPPQPKNVEPGPIETTTTTTTTIIENPTDEDIAKLKREAAEAENNDGDDNDDDGDDDDGDDDGPPSKEAFESASVATAHGSKAGKSKAGNKTTDVRESFHEHDSNAGGSETIDEKKSVHGSTTSHGRHLSVHDNTRESSHHRSRSHHGEHRGRSKSHHRHHRSKSRRGRDLDDSSFVEESATMRLGPLGVIAVRDKSRRRSTAARERDIKAEIRDLEAEKRALKGDHRSKDVGGWEEVVRIDKRRTRSRSSSSNSGSVHVGGRSEVVRVEKDDRGRLNLVKR